MTKNAWFTVDKDGLAKLVEERGKAIVLFELIQNSWDTGATKVDVQLTKFPNRPVAKIVVTDDDPNGFSNLEHAYTLFAESQKKVDATKRGFMNLGEKLVLSLCSSAQVTSTTGRVTFNSDGTLTRSGRKSVCRDAGSMFEAELRMTNVEYEEAVAAFWSLIPPAHCETTLNGQRLECPQPVASFSCQLATRIADGEGYMRPTKRMTDVDVYDAGDAPAYIYEMGIPVVAIEGLYHVNVLQKVPVTMTRDNVPPAYLRKIRAEVLNHTSGLLPASEANASWITNAMEDPGVTQEAVDHVLTHRFGKDRVIYDPTDREANQNAAANGYNVIYGGSLPAGAWDAVRRFESALPAGQVFPTPRPYSDDPNAPIRKEIPPDRWTPSIREVADICRWFARNLEICRDLQVMFVEIDAKFAATWSAGNLEWNLRNRATKNSIENWHLQPAFILDIMLHELAHSASDSHLDAKFHQACTRLGGLAIVLTATRGQNIPHFHRINAKAET